MKNSVNHANCGSTSQVRKLWTVVTVLAGLVDSKFFFFFLGTYRLSHWWSFNLRHWDHTTICFYSSFQSRSPSLSAFLPTAISAFSLFLRFFSFVVSAVFSLPAFFLWPLESSGHTFIIYGTFDIKSPPMHIACSDSKPRRNVDTFVSDIAFLPKERNIWIHFAGKLMAEFTQVLFHQFPDIQRS